MGCKIRRIYYVHKEQNLIANIFKCPAGPIGKPFKGAYFLILHSFQLHTNIYNCTSI